MKRTVSHLGIFFVGLVVGSFVNWNGILSNFHGSKPYEGQDQREVTSFSEGDLEELRSGGGWGLAKPAEFNGYPGPRHVLDFSDQISLNDSQKTAIEASFQAMNSEAKKLGEELISAESNLDSVFRSNQATPELVKEKLQKSEAVRAKLRAVHLLAHLEVTPLLNDEQKKKYEELRGYGDHAGHAGH